MNASHYINFGTSVLTFIFGLLLVTGIVYPASRDTVKITLGIVLMIYGVYRFINTVSKVKLAKMEEKRQKLIAEKEKLLKSL